MDMVCVCCGEPWELDHVLHDEPELFERSGALITACPCCQGKPPVNQPPEQRERLDAIGHAAELLGEDGFASLLDDLGGAS